DPVKNLEAFEAVVRHMKESGIGYGSINHPVDRDPVCGYTGIINDVCPRCGRREGEAVSAEKLRQIGVYKHLNTQNCGCCGDVNEEADRVPNPVD
ncbi:MAG: anaerobic ribonucleoside triphosphate reductase, partial [Oscillospiraceae bacterium]|nr:anaerobic ribonucleoside triphosphate reductase [Oscillospiraceae bacterium]